MTNWSIKKAGVMPAKLFPMPKHLTCNNSIVQNKAITHNIIKWTTSVATMYNWLRVNLAVTHEVIVLENEMACMLILLTLSTPLVSLFK